ncbi:hypothetical protein NC652_006241 [Populus alba x Populus x berolinensis]|nr:hypothetical protein NC652_006241 [Populus alba x Populus x berolinensis]
MHIAWHDASSSLIAGIVLLLVIFFGPSRCFSIFAFLIDVCVYYFSRNL